MSFSFSNSVNVYQNQKKQNQKTPKPKKNKALKGYYFLTSSGSYSVNDGALYDTSYEKENYFINPVKSGSFQWRVMLRDNLTRNRAIDITSMGLEIVKVGNDIKHYGFSCWQNSRTSNGGVDPNVISIQGRVAANGLGPLWYGSEQVQIKDWHLELDIIPDPNLLGYIYPTDYRFPHYKIMDIVIVIMSNNVITRIPVSKYFIVTRASDPSSGQITRASEPNAIIRDDLRLTKSGYDAKGILSFQACGVMEPVYNIQYFANGAFVNGFPILDHNGYIVSYNLPNSNSYQILRSKEIPTRINCH